MIGTPAAADRNLISGNDGSGILLKGPDSVVQNNLIGTNAAGTAFLPNGSGVQLTTSAATGNLIGGTAKGNGNDIAGNDKNGILVAATAGSGNLFSSNRIHDNGLLGIDIGANGVTRNDRGDLDSGPNGLQNFPELDFARINGSTLRVQGFLDSAPGEYRIEIFTSDDADSSGFGEGAVPRGSLTVQVTSGEVPASFVATIALNFAPAAPLFVSATATETTESSTSEFSRAVEARLGGTEISVTNANDSGAGSLRAALNAANANADPNTIVFNIPGDGPHTIPSTNFLAISDSTVIVDGYTQPGSLPNRSFFGTDAAIGIVIDGSAAPETATALLDIVRATGVVRGIVFQNAPQSGVRLVEGSSFDVEGCFFGTDVTGTVDLGNDDEGVETSCDDGCTIGGPSRGNRNLISANHKNGISDIGGNLTILNNLIGTDAGGAEPLGNGVNGIRASGSGSRIGSDEPGIGNVIVGNHVSGVEVQPDTTGVEILGNDVFQNTGFGIDLLEAGFVQGITPNDVDDADDDLDGANALQNFPELTSVDSGVDTLTIKGTLDVPADRIGTVYTLRFYRNQGCDTPGNGEGGTFLGVVNTLIPADETFTAIVPGKVKGGQTITATATDPVTGNTSEFSECFDVSPPPPSFCGDVNLDEHVLTSDALAVLKAAVGTLSCELCVCDANGSTGISTSDALLVLKRAVGQQVTLLCPVCT